MLTLLMFFLQSVPHIFLSLSFFSPVSAELFFLPLPLLFTPFLSVLRLVSLHFLSLLPSCVCSGSHVGFTERGRVRHRDGETERGGGGGSNDLVEEGMSLHAVIGYYFSSSALLFHPSPSHYLHLSERLQRSHSSSCCVLSICVCDGSLARLDRCKLILFCNPVTSH